MPLKELLCVVRVKDNKKDIEKKGSGFVLRFADYYKGVGALKHL